MQPELKKLRSAIKDVDRHLLKLIHDRRRLVGALVQLKSANHYPIRDSTRESSLIAYWKSLGKKWRLEPHFVESLFRLIIEDAVLLQQKSTHEE